MDVRRGSLVVRVLGPLVAACALAAVPAQAPVSQAPLSQAKEHQVPPPPTRLAVIGYLFPRNTLIDPAGLAADQLTHINYAFANVREGRVVEGFDRDAENFKVLAEVRRAHPHLKVLVSVGGWTWSGGFSDAALTADSRRVFVASAVAFVRRHDLDGFDVDWEYPGLRGNGNVHRAEDKENFTALMAELRTALDADGATRNRRLLLTFAAGASSAFLEHTEMAKVQASVDFVNLMTYDFRVASVEPVAGHHANLFDQPLDDKGRSGDRAVRQFLDAGVPARKLVLGVPFYGRGWTNVTLAATTDGTPGTGLYRPGVALTGRSLSYGRLAAELVDREGFVRIWDSRAQQPYLWNAATRTVICYDDPESLRVKARYIREQGLGGAMFWEYGDDPSGALLDALDTGLRR
jgi:chitinase